MSATTHWVIHCDGDFPGCAIKCAPVPARDATWPRTLADRAGWLHLAEYGFDLCPTCRLEVHR